MIKQSIPKFRFRDFDDELINFKIGEISDSYSGGTPSASNKNFYTGTIPFIRSAEINKEETELFVNEAALNQSSAKMVVKGDILYALYGATSGEVGISRINGAINQAILAIKPYKGYSSKFIMQWLRREKNSIIDKYLQGGQGNLSGAIVKNLDVQFPTYSEQSAIGSLFQTLDELLSAYKDNVANYQSIKASMLSQMFPKAGQNTPEIRLDGFDGEWEEKKLIEGLSKIGDGIHGTPKYNDAGEYAFINGNNLVQDSIQLNTETKYVNLNQLTPHDLALDKNTILMSINGTIGSLGWYRNEKVMLSKSVAFLQVDSFDKNFIYYLLQTAQIRKYFFNNLTGTTIKNLGLKAIRNLKISYPILSEQRAIGAFFSNLDNLISSYQDKIEQLETLKKRLLQDMFV